MSFSRLAFSVLISLSSVAMHVSAGENKSAPTKPKSIYNTNIYEANDENEKFTDSVKLTREMEGVVQVFFNKMAGAFTAPTDETAMARIIESQTSKTNVVVVYDESTRKILSVSSAPKTKADKAGAGRSGQ